VFGQVQICREMLGNVLFDFFFFYVVHAWMFVGKLWILSLLPVA